jgi:excisionase family DNA binding protein
MSALLPTSVRDADQRVEPWVSVDDVAAHLGVRKDSIYRWIESRGLPARKIGKLWKMKLSEVDAWVRARGAGDDSAAARATAPARPPRPRPKGADRVVLVIDDEQLVRETIGDFLEDEGFRPLFASDGAEALRALAAASPAPSLIILDLKMPNLDGRHFLEQRALQRAISAIPVIVVTADRRAELDVAATLRKPLRIDQLSRAIDDVLARAERA